MVNKNFQYKLIALDLDGTLLKDTKDISKKTVKYIERLKKNKIEVVIATGRSYYHGKKLIEPLNQDMIILSNNGSIARHTSNDEVIFANYLTKDKAKIIIDEALEHGFHPILHVNEFHDGYDLIIENHPEDSRYYGYMSKENVRFKKFKFEEIKYTNILSICIAGDFTTLEFFRKKITKKYPKVFNSFTARNLKIRALLEFLDIKGCKWEAVHRYAQSKGILDKEIISIGDDNNDIELLKKSGLGIAMINGTEEIKKAADKVTEHDNNNDGVIFELEKYFKIGNDF